MAEPASLHVHRCRFIDYAPSAITALAFSPLPLPSTKGKRPVVSSTQPPKIGMLAVGHSNGNIDLCEWASADAVQSPQAWVIRKTISGTYPSKVDSMALVIRYPDMTESDAVLCRADLRLFSSGGGSELVEWDIERGCIRRTIKSQGGAIWSIAANPAGTILALACEDGTVQLLSIAHDTLVYRCRFDRVKCRILSLAWGPPIPPKQGTTASTVRTDSDLSEDDDDDADAWTDSFLVTGCSDSSLRKWDVSSGRVVDRMGTDKVRGERTLVWTVGVLGDGTMVSGDSLGMVKFWDHRTCTQLQTFQGHSADVLCMAIGPDGRSVYTSGVDQKISQFCCIKPSLTSSSSHPHWIYTCSRRLHSHDVRALATWPPYTCLPPSLSRQFSTDLAPVLASGGLDMSVTLTPAALPSSTTFGKVLNPLATGVDATFENAYYRRIAYHAAPALSVAPQARLVACTREASVSVWKISHREDAGDALDAAAVAGFAGEEDCKSWKKVLEMDLNVHTNLVASALSPDGRWLVVSDMYDTKLFALEGPEFRPRRVRDFTSILAPHLASPTAGGLSSSTGALAFAFTPDGSKLVMATAITAQILVIDLQQRRVLRRFDHHRASHVARKPIRVLDENDDDDGSVSNVSSADIDFTGVSQPPCILRLAVSPDGQWLASSDDRSRTHIFSLDSLQHHCVLPSFHLPAQTIAFDANLPSLLVMAFPDNSLQCYDVEMRQFPAWAQNLTSHLPKRFTSAHDPVLGVLFPFVGGKRRALFWGSTWLCKLDLQTSGSMSSNSSKKKRRRDDAPSVKPTTVDSGNAPNEDPKMILHYRPILHADLLNDDELLVVERPLVDVMATLPPAYFKHRYGAS
ncbi:WD40 repeat-like protein [Fistulina hepatica ATCC 64428]|uniref:WD40 repeat-like protein n=1 Tax=Fistulina hepatica ATCC 64428 TaxID=1128425 RepID=A0A0D7AI16_9AGAR|nr:WD40 repeat-like protein [Fistulina hepatica ATCC 64428]